MQSLIIGNMTVYIYKEKTMLHITDPLWGKSTSSLCIPLPVLDIHKILYLINF